MVERKALVPAKTDWDVFFTLSAVACADSLGRGLACGMLWSEQRLHVIDFEGRVDYGVVEFGVATLYRGDVETFATRLCAGRRRIPAKDTGVHGIDASLVEGLDPFEGEWDRFARCRREGPLVAHNAVFENNLLKSVWPYPPMVPDYVQGEDRMVASWGPWLDTLRIYERVFPGLESYQLESLVEQFRVGERLDALARKYCPMGRRKYHCAGYDALASALLLQRLSEFDGFGTMTVSWLFRMSGVAEAGQQRIFEE